jgi:hypothetical protein
MDLYLTYIFKKESINLKTNESSMGHQRVINKFSEGHQRVINKFSEGHQRVINEFSEGYQRVVTNQIQCDCKAMGGNLLAIDLPNRSYKIDTVKHEKIINRSDE